MKPWEETWQVVGGDVVTSDGACVFERNCTGRDARAKLAAAAPAMARLLLELQSGGEVEGWYACPACRGTSPRNEHRAQARLQARRRAPSRRGALVKYGVNGG